MLGTILGTGDALIYSSYPWRQCGLMKETISISDINVKIGVNIDCTMGAHSKDTWLILKKHPKKKNNVSLVLPNST